MILNIKLNKVIIYFILIYIISIIATSIINISIYKLISNKNKPTSPVEEIRIDTLKVANQELVKEINKLDSIKNEKIHEIKTLNDDSTLIVFYQLLRK